MKILALNFSARRISLRLKKFAMMLVNFKRREHHNVNPNSRETLARADSQNIKGKIYAAHNNACKIYIA
jgi:hypothetical protein